jgi:hypothetical protein
VTKILEYPAVMAPGGIFHPDVPELGELLCSWLVNSRYS